MSTLKVVAGAVAVTGAVVVGYKAIQHYRRKRAEKVMHEAIDKFAEELEKIFTTDGGTSNFSYKHC